MAEFTCYPELILAVDVIKVLTPEVGRTPSRDRESERLSTQLFLWQAPKGATLCQALCFFPTPNKDICHEWWADRKGTYRR